MAFAQRRVGQSLAILLAGLLALAAFSLLTARPGDAASTWTVTFSGGGVSPSAIKAAKGDTIVFQNALPLTPITGLLVPVKVNYGGETFYVGGASVSRSISQSTNFSGSYSVLGLIPLTTSSGSVNVAKTAPAPQPPPPPPPGGGTGGGGTGGGGTGGGGTTPPATGGGGVTPPVVNPPHTPQAGLPRIPTGDPGTVPGNALTNPAVPPAKAGLPPTTPGESVIIAPKNNAGQRAAASGHSLVSTSGTPSSAFGLAALTGVVLLLGVGTALARAMLGSRPTASFTTA